MEERVLKSTWPGIFSEKGSPDFLDKWGQIEVAVSNALYAASRVGAIQISCSADFIFACTKGKGSALDIGHIK